MGTRRALVVGNRSAAPWVSTTALTATTYAPRLAAASGSVFAPEYNQAWSFSFLVYFNVALDGNNGAVISKTHTGAPYSGQVLRAQVDGSLDFEFSSSQGPNWLRLTSPAGSVAASAWYRITYTLNGNGLASGTTCYVNNVVKSLTVNNNSLNATTINTTAFNLYREPTGTGLYLSGRLKDFAWWNTELSPAQETALTTASVDLSAHSAWGNCQNFWRMETGITTPDTSSVIYDRKGADNLTATGFTAGSFVAYP